MSRRTKIWLAVGGVLFLAGCILLIGVMSVSGWNLASLTGTKYLTNEYTLSEPFQNVVVDTNTADVVFVTTEETDTRVVCYEERSLPHTVSVENGTLTIRVQNNKKWYEYIGIHFGSPKLTVYIPKGEYGALSVKNSTGYVEVPQGLSFASAQVTGDTGDAAFRAAVSGSLKIKRSTGDITVADCSVGAMSLTVSTGDVTVKKVSCGGGASVRVSTGGVKLTELTCDSFSSTGDTGDLTLENVLVTGKLTAERSTGSVKFTRCDAAEVFVVTDTGDVSGSFRTDKIFYCTTDTGSVKVPKSTQGGICQVKTDTGDIRLEIK